MSHGPQRVVLVVDPDPGSAAALGSALRREGYQVRVARDGARALQVAVARLPDAIVVDEGTPVVAPRTLVRILRSNPRTASVPILYAGSEPERRPEGANAFVRKPLAPDDVLAAIRALLGEAGASTDRDDERVEGSLTQLPLPDVLQMLGNNRRSGRLVVSTDTVRAEIVFRAGEVVDAAIGSIVAEKALFRALGLRDGRFVFQPGDGTSATRIERPLTELLLEGLGFGDELAALAPELPPQGALLVREGPVAGGEAGATVEELRALLATPQRVSALLDACGAPDLEVTRALVSLLASGEVRVVEPGPEPVHVRGPFLPQADVHALLMRLRRAPGGGAAIGKLVLAGGDAGTRRGAIEGLARFGEFRAAAPSDGAFGTVGALHLGEVRLDVVLLPEDPALSPLWGPLATGALGALVLGPAEAAGRAAAALHASRAAVGWCGPIEGPERAGGADYLGNDPAEALRMLVARSVARARSS